MATVHRPLLQVARKAFFVLSQPSHVPTCRRVLLTNTFRCVFAGLSSYHARMLTTTTLRRAALAERLPSKLIVILQTPSLEYIEKEELDVEILPTEEVKLAITDRAAEQLRSITARNNDPTAALRISVESGGCHGYQYKMELANETKPDDYHFSHPAVRPSNILIDAISLSLLNGSTIDYATELIGSSFRILDNPQAKGSGCGCGISWELKE